MTNQCPICQAPIRKNAKHCTLHATLYGMQFISDIRGAPCAREGCTNRLPQGWRPRIKGSTPRKYCCEDCRNKAKAQSPGYSERHRKAQARYMASVRELERRQRNDTAPRNP